MFEIDSNRVMFKSSYPSVISNGDEVVLSGAVVNGQFHAIACKNLSANWLSPFNRQVIAYYGLIGMAVVSFLLFFMVFPIVFGGVCLYFANKVKQHDKLFEKAHDMVKNA